MRAGWHATQRLEPVNESKVKAQHIELAVTRMGARRYVSAADEGSIHYRDARPRSRGPETNMGRRKGFSALVESNANEVDWKAHLFGSK